MKLAWLSWDKLRLPKCKGGMGFRDMHAFNQALLAKQAWRLIETPDKYFPNGGLLDTVFSGHSSTIWKGILYGLDLVKRGYIWMIRDGASVKHGGIHGFPGEVILDRLLLSGIVVLTEFQIFWTTMVLG